MGAVGKGTINHRIGRTGQAHIRFARRPRSIQRVILPLLKKAVPDQDVGWLVLQAVAGTADIQQITEVPRPPGAIGHTQGASINPAVGGIGREQNHVCPGPRPVLVDLKRQAIQRHAGGIHRQERGVIGLRRPGKKHRIAAPVGQRQSGLGNPAGLVGVRIRTARRPADEDGIAGRCLIDGIRQAAHRCSGTCAVARTQTVHPPGIGRLHRAGGQPGHNHTHCHAEDLLHGNSAFHNRRRRPAGPDDSATG